MISPKRRVGFPDLQVFVEGRFRRRRGARSRIQGIDDRQPAEPGDGPAEADQFLPVELAVRTAEIVDDFGDRLAGIRVARVMRQLEALEHGAVFVSSLGRTEIHFKLVAFYSLKVKFLMNKRVLTCFGLRKDAR
jgi:hypothetical protein